MLRNGFVKVLCGTALLWSFAASAQQAWTTRQASVRAGPDITYPAVATLAPGYPVDVAGCLSDYSWCDVTFNNGYDRGWIRAGRLQYMYQSRRVPLYDYGATIGLPIVTFSLLNYWDDNYRARSWYRDRPRWHSAPHSNWSNDRREWRDRPRDGNWRDRHNEPQYRDRTQYNQHEGHRDGRREPQYRQPEPQYRQPEPQQQQPQPGYRDGPRRGQPQAQAPQPMPAQPIPAQPIPAPQAVPQPQQQQPQARPGRPDGPLQQQPEISRRPPERQPGGN